MINSNFFLFNKLCAYPHRLRDDRNIFRPRLCLMLVLISLIQPKLSLVVAWLFQVVGQNTVPCLIKNFKIHPKVYFSEHRDIHGNLVPQYDGNELTLSGTPTSLEPIDVTINIGFYKHMLEFQDLWFEKQYQLVVKNCD